MHHVTQKWTVMPVVKKNRARVWVVIEPRCTISTGSITNNHTLHPLELSGCDSTRVDRVIKGEEGAP